MHRLAVVLSLLSLVARSLQAQSLEIQVPLADLQARALQDSLDPIAHYNLALGYMSKEQFPEAERSLDAALSIDPRFAPAHLALAVARERDEAFWNRLKGDSAQRQAYRDIGRLYRRAFLIDPFVDVRLLALLYRVSGTSSEASAIKAFLEGRYQEAAERFGREFEDLPEGQPRDSAGTALLWIHALASVQIQAYADAEQDIDALIRLSGSRARTDSLDTAPLEVNEYRYMLAALKQREGQTAEAIKLYEEVLEQDVSNYMAHVQLARIFEAERHWPEAVVERRRAVEVQPDDASLLLDLGITLGKSGDFSGATDALHQAAERNPRDARAFFWLGIADMQLAHREAAREAFARYVAIAPSSQQAQVELAKRRLAALP